MQKTKLNANIVGANCIRPHFKEITLKNQKGITLIALIITIIVMLILVGVTINVTLNGGLFSKAEEAGVKTKIAQIQEALAIKEAELIADNKGVIEEYNLTLDKLDIPTELENEFSNKLIIGKDGKLYYDEGTVTDTAEQNIFKSMGIQEYSEKNTGNSYTFTLGDIEKMEGFVYDSGWLFVVPFENFWTENISEELKNSTIQKELEGNVYATYNITCSNSMYTNMFYEPYPTTNSYLIILVEGYIAFAVFDAEGNCITSEDYENYEEYEDLTFKISMVE